MQIPETPIAIGELELMRRLKAYALGTESWYSDRRPLGQDAKDACEALHTGLTNLTQNALAPILDRTTARELETFTMHDRTHAYKVAHLMWYILEDERKLALTPPEIGLLVGCAFIHDIGLALSPEERQQRLDSESDLWDRLEIDETQKSALDSLRSQSQDKGIPEAQQRRVERQLFQAQELLLSQDTRERHATRQRYEEVISLLTRMAEGDPENIPNPRSVFAFEGDSFLKKLVQVCVSHNQDAEALVERDEDDFALPRFPRDYPVGCCVADTQLVAAALRLADILDFDRERTPPVLFHYLLPGPLTAAVENRSILEWGKHLTISNWHIEPESIVFRGRCSSHVLHHAVVQFAGDIEKEIEVTRATFGTLKGEQSWPFFLPKIVQVQIMPEGYTYVPYRFELDDERVYGLLMGGAIYDNPLVAIRELIQNAVDACQLRDALTRLHEPETEPRIEGRLRVMYTEPTTENPFPSVSVADTGTGMDGWLLERFFLKVGRSFYRSSEFQRINLDLRRGGFAFAPISEFGIGFLSCFLLGDQVLVETAMSDSVRGDMRKRSLTIDGPTRLIRMNEQENAGQRRFRGTKITLTLTRGAGERKLNAPTWEEIQAYIELVCRDLPYPLVLEHVSGTEIETMSITAKGLTAELPPEMESSVFRIPINTPELAGEILILSPEFNQLKYIEKGSLVSVLADEKPVSIPDELRRGGFLIGSIPGLPMLRSSGVGGVLTLKTQPDSLRYRSTNVARTATADDGSLTLEVRQVWLQYLLENPTAIPADALAEIFIFHREMLHDAVGSQVWDLPIDGVACYELGRLGWSVNPRWIEKWESGLVSALPITGDPLGSGTELLRVLLNRTLTHISEVCVGRKANYVRPPGREWRQRLAANSLRAVVTADPRKRLGFFKPYSNSINHFLAYQPGNGKRNDIPYLRFFNEQFSDLLAPFDEEEIGELLLILDRLIDRLRGHEPIELSAAQWELLTRLKDIAGESSIGWPGESYLLRNLLA